MTTTKSPIPSHRSAVVIVGAGFAGIGAAALLRQEGVHGITVLERGHAVATSWSGDVARNAVCDVPAPLCSFTFAPGRAWSHLYPRRHEVADYLRSVVDRFDLGPSVRFGHEVTSSTFDQGAGEWTVHTAGGARFTAPVVILATGTPPGTGRPTPRGIESFGGRVIHGDRWNVDEPVGPRVAVVGDGSELIPIVPEITRRAQTVKVFQGRPVWLLPRIDPPVPPWVWALFEQLPVARRTVRGALARIHRTAVGDGRGVDDGTLAKVVEQVSRTYLRLNVDDPWMRRQLTPTRLAGDRRFCPGRDYLDSLRSENCEFITWPVAAVSPAGLRTADGIEHRVDTIVIAGSAGDGASGGPVRVTGVGGIGGTGDAGDAFPNFFVVPQVGGTAPPVAVERKIAGIVGDVIATLAGEPPTRGDRAASHPEPGGHGRSRPHDRLVEGVAG
jgi:cation diffusion facilitator CzcD-associated flavoprotein CzcO